MPRNVQLACARCGHTQMYVIESPENDEVAAEIDRDSRGREMPSDDTSTSAAAIRLRRLESLPASLPVGGIITPV